MKTKFCDLVVISPLSPRIWKIRVTPQAVLLLCLAFVLSFCATVAITQSFPNETLNESNHAKLAAENQALQVENRNLQLRTRKLNSDLARLEETSERINVLMQAD